MSAGTSGSGLQVDDDLGKLAPRFRAAVEAALAECAASGLDARVYEAVRSPELQALYYARGRTVIPPPRPVTNARNNLYSWHGYGLAVDVISRAEAWNQPHDWFGRVAVVFKKYSCAWGGDWKQADLPHFQWGRCKPSPSDLARQIMAQRGVRAVWQALGADEAPSAPSDGTAAATASAATTPMPPLPAHAPAAVPHDIAALQLNANAQNAAVVLRAAFPQVVFTSGRRSLRDQVLAMASNVIKDRAFIVRTYKPSPICSGCQQWIDAHPQATLVEQIAAGLLSVFQAAPESEVMAFSKHLTGDAFDIQPVEADADAIKTVMRQLPLLEKFLDHEGSLIRWHAQFYR